MNFYNMNKLSQIFTGYFYLTLQKLNFIDYRLVQKVEERIKLCEDCPLYDNGWCSSKKVISINTGKYLKSPFGGIIKEMKLVKGCGCYIKAKAWSMFSFGNNNNPCPRKIWKSIDDAN